MVVTQNLLQALFNATASTLQIREKIHARSVYKWKHFADELAPLQTFLEQAGVKTT